MQHFLTSLFGKLMKTWNWALLILMVLLIKIASTQPIWVEENYSRGIYPIISKVQRAVFGWIPFSVGDLVYAFLALVIIFKTGQLIKVFFKKQFNRAYLLIGLKQIIFFFLFIYVCFYGLWGLNYSRPGIAYQFGLEVKDYSKEDLDTLITTLQEKLNYYAKKVDTLKRDSTHHRKILFEKGEDAFQVAAQQYPFLKYEPKSIKASLYSPIGHLLGFTGYYNPFSGEGQVKTSIPIFLQPFIVTHEIGHQLGFAKENEANFIGFLACRAFSDDDFRYSMYFDMYLYAVYEMLRFDFKQASCYKETLDTQARRDYKIWMQYLYRNRNFVEPLVSRFYDGYLRANNQPMGKQTYNQVVAWLIAYYKKNGTETL